jgi:hypothetical protein
MAHQSTAEDLALHGLRVLGYAGAPRIAGRYGLDPGIVQEYLLDHQARGWVSRARFGGSSGWSLTDAGRAEDERRLATELAVAGPRARREVVAAHQRFLPLNDRLGTACTNWQIRPAPDDPLAVTDEQGEFLLTAQEPFEALDLRVEARAFANKTFTHVSSGSEIHKLTLTEGATVTGRVMADGKPLAGVSVGMVSAERDMENYTGNFDVGTDPNGRFTFVNLPPNVEYFIYGMMNALKPYGAISIQKIQTGSDGATLDAGELTVRSGFRLAGRVVLADGKPVPSKTRLLISRDNAWDSMQVVLDKDGRFDTAGIPKETITLSARVAGYRVSMRNSSCDRMNPFQLVGRVERDTTNLVFLLEKGADPNAEGGEHQPLPADARRLRLRRRDGHAAGRPHV